MLEDHDGEEDEDDEDILTKNLPSSDVSRELNLLSTCHEARAINLVLDC